MKDQAQATNGARRSSAQEFDREIRLRSLRSLSHLLPVLAFVYAAGALLFLAAPPFEPGEPHMLACTIASALVCLVWGSLRVDDPRFDTPVCLATIVIAAGLGLTMFAMSGDPANTTTLAISIVAAGGLLYRFPIYLTMVALVLVGWVAVANGMAMPQYLLGAFHLWASTVVGALILWSRRKLVLNLLKEASEAQTVRTLATDQARTLSVARDAALASAQAKGEFLANVSHEVRTPLNGMLGLLQFIDASKLPAQQGDYLRDVRKAGRSLLAIVNDLLDLSKIEAGEMRLESVPFDLHAMIAELAQNYALAADAKGLVLETEVDDRVPVEICGDPLRIRQVLSNLLNNALKFTERGKVSLEVRVLDAKGAHVDLQLRVNDTGIGVSPKQAATIFRPFSQADASTTRRYGGTGLGLPICTQLIELMGGSLQVQSRPGHGSSFFFDARFEVEEQLSDELAAVTEGLSGLQLLLIEGHHRARETAEAQLQSWGVKVWTATTFDGAMRTLRAPPHPDVTLVDVRTLGTDWRARAQTIAEAATEVRSGVVALCSSRLEIAEMREAGIDVHLEKPVRRAKLIGSVLETIDRRPSRAPLPAELERPSVPVPITKSMRSNGMRVLIAEDNAINRTVIEAHLVALGYEFDTVGDGEAALEALQGTHPYAAVIMDGQMPKMDGYAATRALRAREISMEQRRVPVIALTAHAMSGDRRTALAAGMDDYLSKPFMQKELQIALARWAASPDARSSELPPTALDTTITSQLLDLEQKEPGFLCDVIDSFFETADQCLEAIRASIEDGDLHALRDATHLVRGSSQQLGAIRFGATCREVEALQRAEDAGPLLAELEADLEGAREALVGLAERALDVAS